MNASGRTHPPHFPPLNRHNTPTIVFVTVCTNNRKPILACHDARELLVASWQLTPTWLVGRYVIMPDHVHMFCAPADFPQRSLAAWVSFWKSVVSRKWPRRDERPVWQRHFWDTQLRRGESYDEKWEYVVQNPVRAGLVSRAEEWPYQGELNLLPWL